MSFLVLVVILSFHFLWTCTAEETLQQQQQQQQPIDPRNQSTISLMHSRDQDSNLPSHCRYDRHHLFFMHKRTQDNQNDNNVQLTGFSVGSVKFQGGSELHHVYRDEWHFKFIPPSSVTTLQLSWYSSAPSSFPTSTSSATVSETSLFEIRRESCCVYFSDDFILRIPARLFLANKTTPFLHVLSMTHMNLTTFNLGGVLYTYSNEKVAYVTEISNTKWIWCQHTDVPVTLRVVRRDEAVVYLYADHPLDMFVNLNTMEKSVRIALCTGILQRNFVAEFSAVRFSQVDKATYVVAT